MGKELQNNVIDMTGTNDVPESYLGDLIKNGNVVKIGEKILNTEDDVYQEQSRINTMQTMKLSQNIKGAQRLNHRMDALEKNSEK